MKSSYVNSQHAFANALEKMLAEQLQITVQLAFEAQKQLSETKKMMGYR